MYYNADIQVSVLCLAYNHERYIRETLEGFVIQKTDFTFEVLVHDDCSTDGTSQIIREYQEKYPAIIKPIYENENMYSKGLQIITDILLSKASGKYIAFCEGDDYWTDADKLQKQYEALEKHPECSMSVHKVQCCNEDGILNENIIPANSYGLQQSCVLNEDQLIEILFIKTGYPFHTSSYFVRKEVFGFNIHYPRDIGILRKSLCVGFTYYFNEVMSIRREWSLNSWTSRLKNAGEEGYFRFLISKLEDEELFDKETNFKYHVPVLQAQLSRILEMCSYDINCARRFLITYIGKNDITFKSRHYKMTVKMKAKYMLLKYCPKILTVYYSWKKYVNNIHMWGGKTSNK